MINLLADYKTDENHWGHNEFQVSGTSDPDYARDVVFKNLCEQGYNVQGITIVWGNFTLAELGEIHTLGPAGHSCLFEVFLYDEE